MTTTSIRLIASLLLAAAEPAFAVSLYSGIPARPTATRPLTGCYIPAAPAAGQDVLQIPQLGRTQIPALGAPAAAQADANEVSALEQARGVSDQLSAAAAPGGDDARAALDAAFDGSGQAPAAPPAPAAAAFDESIIAAAQAIYHPALPKGVEAAVAVGIAVRPQGAPVDDSELEARMRLSPLTNPEREQAVRDLFIKAGAAPSEIVTQSAGRGKSNIYVVKKGRTDRVIVVGAHHDKVAEGQGTIDNWTGSTMMINLYQAMRDIDTDATYVFIGFAREEEGLIGSAAYVASLSKAERAKIDAMLNLDTLAVDGTFSWNKTTPRGRQMSTRELLDRLNQVAAADKRDLLEAYLDGGDADSSTFRQAKIPAMTVFGASQDVIFDIIHASTDNMAAFSLPHYRNAYLLALGLLKSLDAAPLGKPARI